MAGGSDIGLEADTERLGLRGTVTGGEKLTKYKKREAERPRV